MIQKIKKWLLIILVGSGLLLFGHYTCQKQKEEDQQIQSEALKPNEREKIIINSKRHRINIISEKGSTTKYYNPRGNIDVIESITGKLSVVQRTWGFERSFGVGFSGDLDLHYNWFYWHNIDTSIGISSYSTRFEPSAFIGMGYNFYGDGILYAKYTTKKQIKVGLEWRVF